MKYFGWAKPKSEPRIAPGRSPHFQPSVAYHSHMGQNPPKSGPVRNNTLPRLDGLCK